VLPVHNEDHTKGGGGGEKESREWGMEEGSEKE